MTTYTVEITAQGDSWMSGTNWQALQPAEDVEWDDTPHALAEWVAGNQTVASAEGGDWMVKVTSDSPKTRVVYLTVRRPDREQSGDEAYVHAVIREWDNRLEVTDTLEDEQAYDAIRARWHAHYNAELESIGYRAVAKREAWLPMAENAITEVRGYDIVKIEQ